MKVLLASWSWYPVGGDWTYVENVKRLYESHGYEVIPFSTKNEKNYKTNYDQYFVTAYDYKDLNKKRGIGSALKVLKNSVVSFEAMRNIDKLLAENTIAFAHLHIIHHWLTPAIIWKLRKHKVPIIWSLHEYKLVCPEGSFVSNGEICERCFKHKFYNCTTHKCKKGSVLASLLASIDAYVYHLTHIYSKVDYFLCPSQFLLEKFRQFGFDEQKLVLSNLCYDIPFIDSEAASIKKTSEETLPKKERYILYVGRIEKIKGILTLIEAVAGTDINLKIAGTGPAMEEMQQFAVNSNLSNVQFLGFQVKKAVFELTLAAEFVVCPSEWYENYPFTVIETLLLGRPVVGAKIGGIPELVIDEVTGLLFESGNVVSLRSKILRLWNDKVYVNTLGLKARSFIYEKVNFERHWSILNSVIARLPLNVK